MKIAKLSDSDLGQEGKEDSCGKLSRLQIIHPNLSLCKFCIYVHDHCPFIVKIIDFQGGWGGKKIQGGNAPRPPEWNPASG